MRKERIKLLTDSCSDILPQQAEEMDIQILCFPITVDGKSYRETIDFTKEEFYEMTANAQEFPSTAQLTPFEFSETFEQLSQAGYTDVIYVSIGAGGSGTNQNAQSAKAQFEQDHADDPNAMRIHIIDGGNYTATYGYAVLEAAKMLKRGAHLPELLDYLQDWVDHVGLYFVPLTLKYVKRSGRVSAAAAFAGELLGLRPFCRITRCKSTVLQKFRGEQTIVPKLVEFAKETMLPHTPYIVMTGVSDKLANELAAALTKQLGYPPAYICKIGAAITCNSGPDVVGLVIRQKSIDD